MFIPKKQAFIIVAPIVMFIFNKPTIDKTIGYNGGHKKIERPVF